jgi:hypothetical protein
MAVDLLGEALAFEQLHSDEAAAFALFDSVDGADIRVIQR